MLRRSLLALGATLGALTLLAAPVGAQTDYEDTTVASASVNADGSVNVAGENCVPVETVDFTVDRTSGNDRARVQTGATTADAEGDFAFTTQPLSQARYEITIVCGDSVTVLGVNVNRGQATAPGRQMAGTLPTTGADDAVPLARLGVILVAAGGVALYGAKKRNGRRAAFLSN